MDDIEEYTDLSETFHDTVVLCPILTIIKSGNHFMESTENE